jgi:hypothetical protein
MSVDPVQGMMDRHQELCAGAVDPLEIAAELEAQGLTDRLAAARFRHRDVFSLAEEMYVRSTRAADPGPVAPGLESQSGRRARLWPARGAAHLLPGALCAAVVVAPAGPAWHGAIALPLAVAATIVAVRSGPLRGRGGSVLWACALLGGVVYGEAAAVALALSVVPAALCARFFAVRSRARLAEARGLDDFAAEVRPLLTGTAALYALALLTLLGAARALEGTAVARSAPPYGWISSTTTAAAVVQAAALGVLLFTARLLTVHGHPAAASAAVGAALALEAFAPAASLLADLRALSPLPPLVTAVPALACLVHAYRALPRATAHHRTYL